MAIPLSQVAQGFGQGDVRDLVQAGMMNRCYLAYPLTPNTDPTIQKKRLELCGEVSVSPTRYLDAFVWMALTQANVTALNQFDETVAKSVINQGNWDMMADLLIATSAVS